MSINFKRTTAIASCALLAALGAAGCGGSGGGSSQTVSAQSYVAALCNGMTPLIKTIQNGQRAGAAAKTPQALKLALENYLNSLASDVSALAAKASSVGVPNVKDGQNIAAAVVTGFHQLEGTLHGLEAQAKALQTTSLSAVTSSAQLLVSKASQAMTSVNSLNSGPTQSAALAKAVASSAACRALSASAG